jgi:6-phosphogluconate dehydrogenase
MQLGMIGLGRMGGNMVRRLIRGGHDCVVYNHSRGPVDALVKDGAKGSTDLSEFVSMCAAPRAIWLMVPAAVVDQVLDQLSGLLSSGTSSSTAGTPTTGTTSARAGRLKAKGIHYVDCGTSGGVSASTAGTA